MIPIYSACSAIDAHLLSGLLAQQGIETRIIGEFLQGAVGELPPHGYIQVLVTPDDVDAALATVREFEARQNADRRWF